MFLEFFKLWDEPFGVTPDPAYLYPSHTHLNALDSLRSGILGGRGFMTLIAEPGMGKTTLLYQLIEQLPQTTKTAYLFQTQCNSLEFMQYLLSELGVDPASMGLVSMHRKLNEMLFDEMVHGKQFVLIVDESQNLSKEVLETVRLLSNFETSHSKLLQIVLAGQPELANKLKQPELSQLLQRITVMAHLDAFSFDETAAYIRHRLKLAGHTGEDLFDLAGYAAVYRRSQGIPRNINRICHAALSLAQTEQVHVVSAAIVERSNQGLGGTTEELQRSRFAARPRPVASTGASVGAPSPSVPPVDSPTQSTPTEQTQADQSFAPSDPLPPSIPNAPPPSATPPRLIPPPLPDFVLPEPKPRSYRWLAWTAVFTALPILAALATPTNVRQALLQKIQPIVNSKASVSDSHPNPSDATSSAPAMTAHRNTPTPASAGEIAKSDSPTRTFKVVIDPGHGGAETGTRGPNGLLEKSVCLEVALRLGQMIEDNLAGAEVVYTRSDDQNISLQRRAALANESTADLFISIHADSTGENAAPGVYYSDSADDESKGGRNAGGSSLQLAGDLQNALAQIFALKRDAAPTRAPAQPTFAVLNGVHVPSVMVEIPFAENESPLLDPAKRQQLAEGLYQGIAAYVKDRPDRTAR
jgi:type II secretory pathway predicted ATPase ExeA